jgi:hypothetical protein
MSEEEPRSAPRAETSPDPALAAAPSSWIRGFRVLALPLCCAIAVTAIHLDAASGGEGRADWSIPVDDTYIHLQYARSIARGHPFAYHPGDGFSTGSTSPLYAILLAPGFLVGLDGLQLVPVVIVLGGVWLLLSLLLILRLGRQLEHPIAGQAAAVLWGSWGFTWFCLYGGMETGLYVCLILATASLAIEWSRQADLRPRPLLCVAAGALPLTRPDGLFLLLALLGIAGLRALRGPRRVGGRGALLRVALLLSPTLIYFLLTRLLTGSFSTAGMVSKSLLHAPYLGADEKALRFLNQLLESIRGFLGGGDPLFLSPLIAIPGIAALLALATRELRRTRGLCGPRALLAAWMLLALAAASMHLIKIAQWTRYYLPCFVLVILGAGLAFAWIAQALRRPQLAIGLAVALALLQGEPAIRWVKKFSADALVIHQKQTAAARAVGKLPPGARVLVCDAGAIPYLSRRWSFDIVGLTTRLRGNPFRNGVGSRFELFESLPPDRRPTHVAAYDFCLWPGARGAPLGVFHDLVVAPLIEAGAGSGEQPGRVLSGKARVVDRLDLADLESEAGHRYRQRPAGSIVDNLLRRARLPGQPRLIVDGGRRVVTGELRFELKARPATRATILLRTSQETPVRLELLLGKGRVATELAPIPPSAFSEAVLELPAGIVEEKNAIQLRAPAPTPYVLYHVFLVQD